MTEPDFDDPSYADLRDLLSEAAAPAALPADVAAALDATLAGLVADRTEAGPTVTRLETRRRRGPGAQRLLVAAAAVVLLGAGGVGIAQLDLAGNGQSDDSAAASTADRESAGQQPAVPGGRAPEPAAGGGTTTGSATKDGVGALNRLTRVPFTEARFAAQVGALLDQRTNLGYFGDSATGGSIDPGAPADSPAAPPLEPTSGEPPAPEVQPQTGSDGIPGPGAGAGDEALKNGSSYLAELAKVSPTPCKAPRPTVGATVLGINFAGRPAALVVHPVVDGTRYVAAWSCNGRKLLAYTTVPAS